MLLGAVLGCLWGISLLLVYFLAQKASRASLEFRMKALEVEWESVYASLRRLAGHVNKVEGLERPMRTDTTSKPSTVPVEALQTREGVLRAHLARQRG